MEAKNDRETRRNWIAKTIASYLHDGDLVNLGIGIPTLVANYIPDDIEVIIQSENGIVGMGPAAGPDEIDPDITNAGGQPMTMLPGAAMFDTALSFAMIRGGHLDATVLGALEVDQEGNLANWQIPGVWMPGMGGAMDLTVGAGRVIVATEHLTKKGKPKLLRRCSLPLTAAGEVNLIVTDLGAFEVLGDGLRCTKISPWTTREEIIEQTDARVVFD